MASGESSFNLPHQDEEEIKISSPIKSDLLKVDENKPVSGKVSIAMNDLLESLLDHTNMDTKDEHLSDIPQTSTVTKKDDMNGNMSLNINICKRHINAIFFMHENQYVQRSVCLSIKAEPLEQVAEYRNLFESMVQTRIVFI